MVESRGAEVAIFLAKFLHDILDNKVGSWILIWILNKWQINDEVEGTVDGVMITSYAAATVECPGEEDRLTHGSALVTMQGWNIARRDQNTLVVWGTYGPANAEVEQKLKQQLLTGTLNFCFGSVTSTTDEADAGLKKLQEESIKRKKEIRRLVVSSEASHSRRQRIVLKDKIKNYFPKATLLFVSANALQSADPQNPMVFQRYWEVWLPFNMFFGMIYKNSILLWIFNKMNFHQPTAK